MCCGDRVLSALLKRKNQKFSLQPNDDWTFSFVCIVCESTVHVWLKHCHQGRREIELCSKRARFHSFHFADGDRLALLSNPVVRCVRACVRASVRACVCVFACARVCAFVRLFVSRPTPAVPLRLGVARARVMRSFALFVAPPTEKLNVLARRRYGVCAHERRQSVPLDRRRSHLGLADAVSDWRHAAARSDPSIRRCANGCNERPKDVLFQGLL